MLYSRRLGTLLFNTCTTIKPFKHATHHHSGCSLQSLANRGYCNSSVDVSKIVAAAQRAESSLDYDKLSALLSKYIKQNYDEVILLEILGRDATHAKLSFADYLAVYEICKSFSCRDLELLNTLSDGIRFALRRLYLGKDGVLSSTRKSDVVKESINDCLSVCQYFNEIGLLYDPLFNVISKILVPHVNDLTWPQLDLVLYSYSKQRYRDAEIVSKSVERLESIPSKFDAQVAASIYCSLCYLGIINGDLKQILEPRFLTQELDLNTSITLAYVNMMTNRMQENLEIILVLLDRVANKLSFDSILATTQRRKLKIVLSCLKCLHVDSFNSIDDDKRQTLLQVVNCSDNASDKITKSKFVEKLSQHLSRLRIRNETNVYANGVLLDIVECNRNVVWRCNSYHRFYATTLDETVENRFLNRVILAFGYKLCPIHYYQWGRLKTKRTRIAYIRMARYYALNDVRESKAQYCGWSLPYVWWNIEKKDQVHISHYINHPP